MSVKKWAMLRRAGTLARRHREAVSGSWRFRRIVHEMHRRVDMAMVRSINRETIEYQEKLIEQARLERLEQDL